MHIIFCISVDAGSEDTTERIEASIERGGCVLHLALAVFAQRMLFKGIGRPKSKKFGGL